MGNQQILEKAIQKAIDGGWLFFEDCMLLPTRDWIIPSSITVWNSYLNDKVHIPQQCVISNHDFAKALWGNGNILTVPSMFGKLTRVYRGLPVSKPEPSTKEALIVRGWHFHLQKMVIAEDPIKYLGENI